MWVLLLSPLSSKKGRKGDCSKPCPHGCGAQEHGYYQQRVSGEQEKGNWEEQKIIYIKKVT